jgi:hypothetical protein
MKALWPRIRPLILFGWLVALIRFGIDASVKPAGRHDPFFWFGVYTLMPVAYLVTGIRGTLDDVRWPKIALMALILGVLVWGLPNLVVYTTAHALEWTHGRFALPEGTKLFADTGFGTAILRGLITGATTSFFGAVASLVTLTLFVWLPGVIRRRRGLKPAG